MRKLAEAGQLTSQAVIGALQGQARTLQAEFSQLPPTVGRALQNLSTEWTRYVGEVDKANGISLAAARAINGLAGNLDTLGALLYSAGKAAIAWKAVKLAESLVATATAARTATVAIKAGTSALTANTAASGSAAAGASRFAAIIGSLKLGGLLAVVTNFREIGTAIGEGAARLAGWNKVLEENERKQRAAADAARADAQAKAELAQKTALATEKALGLNDASRKMVGDFEQAIKKGEEAADAIGKVAKALDLHDIEGIQDAVTALDVLRQRGEITATTLRDTLAGALKGIDLGVFETQARAAFDGSEQGARRLAAAIDALRVESLARAGTPVEELATGFSKAANSALNDVDTLVRSLAELGLKGGDAGNAVARALDKAIEAASTERAVRAVEDRFKSLGAQSLLSGQQVAQARSLRKTALVACPPERDTPATAKRLPGEKFRHGRGNAIHKGSTA
ncbi:MAG TPA: tape measure protein [Burkholderiaceae bacterium]|nr:tape measure protein [Burkholderiaceae bacterium]